MNETSNEKHSFPFLYSLQHPQQLVNTTNTLYTQNNNAVIKQSVIGMNCNFSLYHNHYIIISSSRSSSSGWIRSCYWPTLSLSERTVCNTPIIHSVITLLYVTSARWLVVTVILSEASQSADTFTFTYTTFLPERDYVTFGSLLS